MDDDDDDELSEELDELELELESGSSLLSCMLFWGFNLVLLAIFTVGQDRRGSYASGAIIFPRLSSEGQARVQLFPAGPSWRYSSSRKLCFDSACSRASKIESTLA